MWSPRHQTHCCYLGNIDNGEDAGSLDKLLKKKSLKRQLQDFSAEKAGMDYDDFGDDGLDDFDDGPATGNDLYEQVRQQGLDKKALKATRREEAEQSRQVLGPLLLESCKIYCLSPGVWCFFARLVPCWLTI